MSDIIHGGDWAGYEEEFGREPLDFSMNVNPLGVPEEVVEAIYAAAKKADRYPDPECRRLRNEISRSEKVPFDWIRCGNGAADIIDRIALGFSQGRNKTKTAILTAPTFTGYEEALERCGWEIYHVKLDRQEGFRLTERVAGEIEKMLADKNAGFKIVFICEPNNPTGQVGDKNLLTRLAEACREHGSIMVVDECFNGFLDEPERHSLKDLLEYHPQIIILRAFTKTLGMAGVRLGYCLCSDGKKLDRIKCSGQPWSVSYIAEEAGIAALTGSDYLKKTKEMIGTQRRRLKEELRAAGIEEIYGEANYILFRLTENFPDPDIFIDSMKSEGILVRDCSNYRGLDKGWFRIAVKKSEENDRLIEAMKGLI